MSKLLLKVESLSFTYNAPNEHIEILKDINFRLNEGEIVGLIGPSGSGKSTFLNCIGLLDNPSSGNIEILGSKCNHISDYRKTKIRAENIGFVFQSHRLFPEFSALENVLIPQLLTGVEKGIAYKNAKDALKMLGLKNRLDFRPAKLSGGEAQRVAIARAIANAPKIILADEPTGNLDIKSSNQVFEILSKIVNLSKISCILATHNIDLAKKLDKVYSIENKNLKIVKTFN